jgi:hypothetical protein
LTDAQRQALKHADWKGWTSTNDGVRHSTLLALVKRGLLQYSHLSRQASNYRLTGAGRSVARFVRQTAA